MKKTGLVLASVLALSACGESKDVKLDTEVSKASYAIGYKTGEQMNGRMDDLDFEAFVAGMRVGAKGSEAEMRLTAEEMDVAITEYQKQKFEQMEAELAQKGEANLSEGAAFREENGKKDGVTTLESGLQYEVLASGDGEMPTLADTVIAHYHGTLIDGTVFDSSVDRGEPATFPLNRVIEGWQEALTMMHVGDKWKIVIPSEMAYGPSGVAEVGPNATLVFEVELLEVEKAEDSAEG
ncbi:MAG: FKBP-type peptidyl-prolyl cis-trans isomerase [Gammaproteobacteria bacterium]|nr:FKBP-type peptidyl-prolyl cis-trans isomerase [Gammaproteobacteria bacterium]MBQ0775182.1 FKBP-type peptidyl-prolyl cis-trans isomerase [Gammaproteobacteria bacterium]